jgi:CBS domain-containing protein
MMNKPICSLIEQTLVTVHTEDFLETVESVLDLHDLTYVPVVDMHGRVFGIITAHDLVHFHTLKRNAKVVRAWEICTHHPVEVDADASVLEVAELMVTKKIHHVLVTRDGSLLGVISPFNLVEQYLLEDKDAFDNVQQSNPEKKLSASTPNSYTY